MNSLREARGVEEFFSTSPQQRRLQDSDSDNRYRLSLSLSLSLSLYSVKFTVNKKDNGIFVHQGVRHWDGVTPCVLWILGLGQHPRSHNGNLANLAVRFLQCEAHGVLTLHWEVLYFSISICICLKAVKPKVFKNLSLNFVNKMVTYDLFSS